MIELIKEKIENLVYTSPNSNEELDKIIGASLFAIRDASKEMYPRQPEYENAINEFIEIRELDKPNNYKDSFNYTKLKLIESIGKLVKFRLDNPSIYGSSREIMKGQRQIFSLLMVEQKYIDYFKVRTIERGTEPHDRLQYHYIAYPSYIIFNNENDIPFYIQEDAKDAFKQASQ